ncbi:Gfo/Idh/MocA family oxidoreductase [Streptomyces sp. 110]|uniref:Gfo/Idh/MocA family oxidoreductase n=1 Tax=Streptomyces endocoffeicus TaxID=2898945 RepID=A0ABS1PKQ0_9ACTN|nr:Gfo/Idh/MocA family oxidoreductase [Streptomyces endocoffeicus]MBL1112978.1 Gfo/Idh/MocA family oxidoreductase [Streptomyces endocoffeicus]
MTRKVRVGIIGCGKIALNHAKALLANDHVELLACCDIDGTRAAEFARRFGIPHAYDDATDLMRSGVDTVTVCTPHPTHEATVVAAARNGLNVLCEKPISVSLTEADHMIAAAESAGVTFGVLFQRRFWEASQRAHEAVRNGRIGTPVLASVALRLGRDAAYFNSDPWRGTWDAEGGGVLINQAIHYIDLLQWCVGSPVVRVSGSIATLKHSDHIEVEDTAVATLEFASGALGVIQAGTTFAPGLGTQVLVTGDNGATVSITEFPEGEPAFNDIWTVAGEESYRTVHSTEIDSDPPLATIHEGLTPYHARQIDDFVDAVVHGREPLVTGREARKALEIVLAVYESARTGRPVHLGTADLAQVAP